MNVFFSFVEPQKFSDDGIEQHIHVNHVAPAFLSLLLLPSLLRAPSARIINVNSMVQLYGEIDSKSWNNKIEDHEFSSFRAYRSSKLAHLMFLKVLASKLSDQKKASVECIAVHPGAVSTKITTGKQKEKHIFFLLTAAEGNVFLSRSYSILFFSEIDDVFFLITGARSVLFSATSPDVGESLVNGFGYYSCDCKPSRVSPKALDNEACLDVWQKTIDILELNEDDLIRLNDE
ncbi:hypothetical protein GIB67_022217 [Kingdonia uniflora]|uniref:Uncharacterized protein n=1 Tax=Kingdonia uniflora TaxID=39325 RepID=A0A7J7M6V4_9MAGN|nr:hypothetical protein GIB67_022217 [Kingdonia uniflora]